LLTFWRWRTVIITLTTISTFVAAHITISSPGGRGTLPVIDRREKVRARRRLFIFASLLALIAAALIVQLVRLTVVLPAREGEETIVLPEVQRGNILDRRGRILAISTRLQRVSVWVPSVTNADETAGLLSQALGMEKDGILGIITRHDGYAVIKRRITPAESAEVQRLKSQGKLPGVRLEEDSARFYPQGTLASHVVGYVGADNVALDGIEYTFNDDLAPQPVGKDSDTVYGNQVFLTIDLDMQYLVDKVARAALTADKADSMTVLVMDARSGEILAYTALPDFDPNEFQRESPQIDPNSLVNRPLTVAYEPGSVFKIFSLSSLLDLGAISEDSHFFCPGYYEKKLPNGETIRIRCISAHGDVTPQKIIQLSCNAGAAYASDAADNDSFARMITQFGFGRPTGLPLQAETPGLVRKVAQWSARSKPTMAMGQELSVSAMQVLAAATAIANGGVLLKPLIVRKIVSPQGRVVKEFGREPLWEAVSPGTARKMLDWMETATAPAGTARRAAVPGVRISAKTGTAQVANPQTGTYSENDFVASMIGIFPSDDPQFIVYVVIQNPKGESYYGSTLAAPVFHDIAVGLIDQTGMSRAGARTVSSPERLPGSPPRQVEIGPVMPDLSGTPLKLLLPLLLRKDISVIIKGSGYVARQDPPPGTQIVNGAKIVLELR
jgi:cell division protein FtsI (penicillin-binding protein 3)